MRKTGLALVAVAAAACALTAPLTAQAMAGTCKMVKSWCPAALREEKSTSSKRTEVPEPASLLLLGIGATAAGAAVARRRKK